MDEIVLFISRFGRKTRSLRNYTCSLQGFVIVKKKNQFMSQICHLRVWDFVQIREIFMFIAVVWKSKNNTCLFIAGIRD